MKIVLTGAGDAVAREVARGLVRVGADVGILGAVPPELAGVVSLPVDPPDPAWAARALQGSDVLVHLDGGGQARWSAVLDAVRGTGCRRIVLASTVAVYGPRQGNAPVTEVAGLRPSPGLGARWAETERLVRQSGVPAVVARAAVTVGRAGIDGLGRRLYAPALSGLGDADTRWQFVHHDDVARFLVEACLSDRTGVVNVAAAGHITAGDIGMLLERCRTPVGRARLPVLLDTTVLAAQWDFHLGWDVREAVADLARIATRVVDLGGGRRNVPWRMVWAPTDLPAEFPAADGNQLADPAVAGHGGEFDARIDPAFPLFTAANLAEAFPGPMTALSLDVMMRAVRGAAWATSYLVALGDREAAEMTCRSVVPAGHRLYLGVSNLRAMADAMPGWSAEDIDVQYLGVERRDRARPRLSAAELRTAAKIASRFAPRLRAMRPEADRLRADADALLAGDVERLTDAQLHARLRLSGDLTNQGWNLAAFAFTVVGAALSAAQDALGPDDLDSLRMGAETLASAAALRGVHEIAEVLRTDPAVRAQLAAGGGRPDPESLRTASRRFGEVFDRVLRAVGHRGPGEGELANRTFADNPQMLLDAAAAAMSRPVRVAPAPRELPWRARLAVSIAQRTMRNREYARDVSVRLVHVVRLLARECGRRLVEAGELERVEDVFHLTLDEVLVPPADVRGVVDRRTAERARLAALRMPAVWERSWALESDATAEPLPFGGVLRGQGASRGVVRGVVRLVTNPFDDDFEPGEILVAHVSDPGWTPLFGGAQAVVTDIGAMASHAAIVAREFGVPAVVGTQHATARLATGMSVEVDGSAGTVTRIRQ